MVVVADRFEVSRLAFSFESPPISGGICIEVPPEWTYVVDAKRLVVTETVRAIAVDAEAGLLISVAENRHWIIVAGSQPATLAVQAPFVDLASDAQYPPGEYKQAAL
jgi:hypothetical protein